MEHIARTPRQMGQIIRRLRKQKQMTQMDVSSLTNVRQATISKVENGDPGTQLNTLAQILLALNLELVVRERTQDTDIDAGDLFL